LRIRLSQVFNILRSIQAVPHSTEMPVSDSPLEQLERLGKLRDAGVLTDEEFHAARAPLVRKLTEST
jgi:CHAD domain-containing protein